jgi:hypothetical protein
MRRTIWYMRRIRLQRPDPHPSNPEIAGDVLLRQEPDEEEDEEEDKGNGKEDDEEEDGDDDGYSPSGYSDSDVRWRAARVRISHLLSSAQKPNEEIAEKESAKAEEKGLEPVPDTPGRLPQPRRTSGLQSSRVNEEIVLPRPATVKSYWLSEVVEYSNSCRADLLVFIVDRSGGRQPSARPP